MIHINVSILYANTADFSNTLFSVEMDITITRVFCYGNELLWLHLSANKDAFYSVHITCEVDFPICERVAASQYPL